VTGAGGQASYHVRDAGAGDVAAMAAVLGDWCRDTHWMPKLHTQDQYLWFVGSLLQSHVLRIGCVADGLGFLARRGGEVDALYLAPAARGRGLGKALLDDAKRSGPLGLWTFQANLGARAFYARAGFHEVAMTDGANDEALPDVRMEWRG
jgi:GNAT superfamily N-acetyltransferase